jgi:hypothetical protein
MCRLTKTLYTCGHKNHFERFEVVECYMYRQTHNCSLIDGVIIQKYHVCPGKRGDALDAWARERIAEEQAKVRKVKEVDESGKVIVREEQIGAFTGVGRVDTLGMKVPGQWIRDGEPASSSDMASPSQEPEEGAGMLDFTSVPLTYALRNLAKVPSRKAQAEVALTPPQPVRRRAGREA